MRETNVKTLNAGWQKRDPSKESVRSTDSHRIAFLLEFAQWLIDWQAMGQSATSLTQETFQCAIQTAQTLPKFAVYLIKKRGYKFVLLWNSNSQISSKGPSDVTNAFKSKMVKWLSCCYNYNWSIFLFPVVSCIMSSGLHIIQLNIQTKANAAEITRATINYSCIIWDQSNEFVHAINLKSKWNDSMVHNDGNAQVDRPTSTSQ